MTPRARRAGELVAGTLGIKSVALVDDSTP